MLLSLASFAPPTACKSLSNSSSINISVVSYFFYDSICVEFEFHIQHYHFYFIAAFLFFLGSSPLWSSHGFITGTQGGSTATCFAACVCDLSNKCARTSHQQVLREVMLLVSNLDKSLSFTWRSVDQGASREVCSSWNHSQLSEHDKWNWNHAVGTGVIELNHNNWNSCLVELCKLSAVYPSSHLVLTEVLWKMRVRLFLYPFVDEKE